MTAKMQGKQPISGGADLSAFIAKADSTMEQAEKVETRGRPKAAPGKAKTKALQIRITEEEWDRLNEAAGLATVATYVRAKMIEAGILED